MAEVATGTAGDPPHGWPVNLPYTYNPNACVSVGLPKCPHCGETMTGYSPHWCAGLADERVRKTTAEAIAHLTRKGYRVIDPEAGR